MADTATATPTNIAIPVTAPVVATTVQSPVSTTPPPSMLSDAGKPEPEATDKSLLDGAKAEGEEGVKTEGEKPAEAEKKIVPPTVPEKYEIKLPEGITLDEVKLEKFTPLAKELGLSNDGVQKLVDYQLAVIKDAETQQQHAFTKLQEDFYQETVKEYGPKLKEELVYVAKGRDNLADKEVIDLLHQAGLSNHKSVIRMFAKAGREISEGRLVDGKTSVGAGAKTDGEILYPNLPKR